MRFDVLANEIRKFMCVLTHGWYTDGSTPVKVQICELKWSKIPFKLGTQFDHRALGWEQRADKWETSADTDADAACAQRCQMQRLTLYVSRCNMSGLRADSLWMML